MGEICSDVMVAATLAVSRRSWLFAYTAAAIIALLALAVLHRRFATYQACAGAAAVPVAIFSNVMRILLMATLIRYFGAQSVSGWLHDVPALVTLPVGLVLYFLLLKFIGSFSPAKTPSAPGVP